MKKFLPLVLLALLSPAFATTVQNLDSVPNTIQHPEGKQILVGRVTGATPAKGFGELPQGLSEKQWIVWVAPDEDPDNLILTGAKSWGKDGKYIGVAYFTDNKANAEQAKKYVDNIYPENYSSGRANKLYLGVLSWWDPQLTPITRSEKPLNQLSEWNKAVKKGGDGESVRPLTYYTKLDLAPYRAAPDTLAFGVRGRCSDTYSSGGTFYKVLELYTIKDGEIVNVFSDLVYYYSDIAEDWNKDDTRQHNIGKSKYIPRMRSTKTHGFYDLEHVSLQDKSSQIFRWPESLQRYAP